MRRLKVVSVVVALALALAASPANAELYDFDDIPSSGPLGTPYTEAAFNGYFSGISFDNIGANGFQVVTTSGLGSGFSGNAISNRYYDSNVSGWVQGSSTVATFDVPVTSFSLNMGDLGLDVDELYLFAHASDNSVVDSDYFYNPAESNAGHALSVTGANIAWVEFYGRDPAANNSIYWDNVCFTPVPVPGAAVLGMLGLGAAGIRLRKRGA